MSNLNNQLINYYSYKNENRLEYKILEYYNSDKYNEINLFTGNIYTIKNVDTNIKKSCMFNSLCNYNNDGILVTDDGDIFGYDDYGFETHTPIKINLYNSYQPKCTFENKLFHYNKHLKLSDLFYKGFEFKGVWVVL